MYACDIMGYNLHLYVLGRIIFLHKKLIRSVCNVGYSDHTDELFCNLTCLIVLIYLSLNVNYLCTMLGNIFFLRKYILQKAF